MLKKLIGKLFYKAFFSIYFILALLFELLLVKIYLKKRIKNNKLDGKFYLEKLAVTEKIPYPGKYIWIYAASVGEIKSVENFIENWLNSTDDRIILTGFTLTGRKLAEQLYKNPRITISYAPLDLPISISRFIKKWRPDKLIVVDSEIWPIIITMYNSPKYIINARLSNKSYNNWKKVKFIISNLLSKYKAILTKSYSDFDKFNNLADNAKNIKCLGDLKLEYKPTYNHEILNFLQENFQADYNIILVSIHEAEYELYVKLVDKLLKNHNINIFIAPRHPQQSYKLITLLNNYNLDFQVYNHKKQDNIKIYIINQIGVLDNFYAVSKIAVIGGSLCEVEGHNPIEAIYHNNVIFTGYKFNNFKDLYNQLSQNKAVIIVNNIEEMAKEINFIINDSILAENYQNNAQKYLKMHQNISQKIVKYVQEN